MNTAELMCSECGEVTLLEDNFCEHCNTPTSGRKTKRNHHVSTLLEGGSGVEYYERVEFYEGSLPVPEHVCEEWFESEVTNIIFKVPLTLNTIVDAQGRSSLDCHIQKIIGVKLEDIAYSMSLEDTLFYQREHPDASRNTVVVEVEGILAYNKTGLKAWVGH